MPSSIWARVATFFINNKLVAALAVLLAIGLGLAVVPFPIADRAPVPRSPLAVDAIPDLGDNQHVVMVAWPGRSPRDIEDQVTYPLSTSLMGLAHVASVRASSMLGFSSITVIFEEDTDYYWARTRVTEKLAALPPGLLPGDAAAELGPDATALGQVFWYTLEARDQEGRPISAWDLEELRSIQDFQVRLALQSVPGVAEISSIGGYTREYQIDVDPEALSAYGITLAQVAGAVRASNRDVGARTLEINRVEYIVRSRGYVESESDIEMAVITSKAGVPVRVGDVASVGLGPASRRGALDDAGAEVVGGVVVARYGANPVEVIAATKARIAEVVPTLPRRTLEDGTIAHLQIVPFYDRSELIDATLDTLGSALWQQLCIAVMVVILLLRQLRASALIAGLLPLAVIISLLAMRAADVTANVMSLAGIAIAIGTMVDLSIIMVVTIADRLREAGADSDRRAVISAATAEVAPAIVTSTLTTIVSFLPVFALTASEGRLFHPLALTKTFAMAAALLLALTVVPAAADLLLPRRWNARSTRGWPTRAIEFLVVALGLLALAGSWQPLGGGESILLQLAFVIVVGGAVLGGLTWFLFEYERLLRAVLRWPLVFAVLAVSLLAAGGLSWRSLDTEFMPDFDEGTFLYMPTTTANSSFGQALETLQDLDTRIAAIPEVDRVVGKLGRVDSALDPAPVSMFEIVITYVPEYGRQEDGKWARNWREHIRSPEDIFTEVQGAAAIPGVTSAPILMPISTRLLMLQTGVRAPLALKVYAPSSASLERALSILATQLRATDSVDPATINPDRTVSKPYLEINIDRRALTSEGLTVHDVQQTIELAVGGPVLTTTVEGRERYPIRVRYTREDRNSTTALERVLVQRKRGPPIPLAQVAEIKYVRAPQVIKSENGLLVGYISFDNSGNQSDAAVVQAVESQLEKARAQETLRLPDGVRYEYDGTYKQELRSQRSLRVLIPIALLLVIVILQLQFKRITTTLSIVSGIAVAVSGAFVFLWLYAQPWFLDIELLGTNLRDALSVGPIRLSAATWVGIIALIGIATDDGVVMATFLDQSFGSTNDRKDIIPRVMEAGRRRIRACLMTTATTVLALLPVLGASGPGGDVMLPLAVPIVGGMFFSLISLFVVPTLYAAFARLRSSV